MRLLIYTIVCLCVLTAEFWWTSSVTWSWTFACWKAASLLALLFLLARTARLFMQRYGNKKITSVIVASLISVCMFWNMLEIVFMFIPRSHGVGYTLGNQIWDAWYWQPLDTDGYRGKISGRDGGVRVLLCGDSFTAGHGIRNVNSRYGNLLTGMLEDKLNKPVQVINLGVCGLDTPGEFTELKKYFQAGGTVPDLVVLQHYGNDIEESARRFGLFRETFREVPENPVGKVLVDGSYVINFLYWLFPHHEDQSWWRNIEMAWQNEPLVQEHFRDIDSMAVYCRSLRTKLAILAIPFLEAIPASRKLYLGKLSAFCLQQGIEIMDVSNALENIPFGERVVSKADTHASESAQKVIADSLLHTILGMEKVPENGKFRTDLELSEY